MSARAGHRAAVLALIALAAAVPGSAQEPPFLGSERSALEILAELSERLPRRLRQVGTTSVTLRADLGGGLEMAFKPRTRSHSRGYAAEIAAYRIARALGMDNVPPVVGRRLPRPLLQQRFESGHPEDWEAIRGEILWDAPGIARGAAIYWVPRMRPSELATVAGLEAASPWLSQAGEVPPDRSTLARDLSTMLAFDYLIGNWDRFSGGNVSTDASGRRLFVRDHNVAFLEPLRGERYERVRRGLERVQRFSRSFVERVRALDREAIEAALREDPEGRERDLLDARQIEGVLARRRALLSYVGALVEVHGADRVFAWP
ncbi:MAG TPA: hypothetical protein VIL20_23535 [Sandaracinaceae bacterium]